MRASLARSGILEMTQDLHEYMAAQSTMPSDGVLDEIVHATNQQFPDVAHMVVAPEQAGFLDFLVRIVNPRNAVEVGTFTGYSSVCIARALSPGARLRTFDVSETYTAIARSAWRAAGVADVIELTLGPAERTLRDLPADRTIDFAFIDGHKPGYIAYWEALVPRMAPGGVLVVDNTLFAGEVLRPDESTKGRAVRDFNAHALADPRVRLVLVPVGDGATLARRLP